MVIGTQPDESLRSGTPYTVWLGVWHVCTPISTNITTRNSKERAALQRQSQKNVRTYGTNISENTSVPGGVLGCV